MNKRQIDEEDYVEIGTCSHLHGLKGGLSIHFYNPQSRSLKKGLEVLLCPKSQSSNLVQAGEKFKVLSANFGSKKCILFLDGVDSVESAQSLLPFTLFLQRKFFPKLLASNQYYISDLIGLTAVSHNTIKSRDEILGTVIGSFENGAQSILKIQLLSGELLELPFVDDFFPKVNLDEGRIEVIVPEYIEAAEEDNES